MGWQWAARPSTGWVRNGAAPGAGVDELGRPATAAQGHDGFAVVAAGGAVGAALGAAVQGQTTRLQHTAQVPSPMSISQVVRRAMRGLLPNSETVGVRAGR